MTTIPRFKKAVGSESVASAKTTKSKLPAAFKTRSFASDFIISEIKTISEAA